MSTTRLKMVAQNRTQKEEDPNAPFLALEHIESGTGNPAVGDLPTRGSADAIQHNAGDVLFSKLRPYLSKSFLPSQKGCATSELVAIRPYSGLDARFLFYITLSSPWLVWAESTSYGSKMPRTSWESLSEYRAWIPPLEEQRRIADFLDAETDLISQIISLREQQKGVLADHRYAYISELLFPGITAPQKRGYPWPWLPQAPLDSPLVRLGYVCRIQGGVTIDGSRESATDSVTRPYLRVANVQADHVDLSSVSEVTVPLPVAARSTLQPGDVLMTEGGDLDKLGRGTVWRGEIPDALHQNHVFALRPAKDRLDADYLALLTQSLHGRCYFESTGVRSTNLASTSSSKVLAFPIPLPDLPRQHHLAASAHKALEDIQRTENSLTQQISLLAERRQALITAAVTGQLDVTTAGRAGQVAAAG